MSIICGMNHFLLGVTQTLTLSYQKISLLGLILVTKHSKLGNCEEELPKKPVSVIVVISPIWLSLSVPLVSVLERFDCIALNY